MNIPFYFWAQVSLVLPVPPRRRLPTVHQREGQTDVQVDQGVQVSWIRTGDL